MKKQILMRLWLIAFCALTSVFASAQFCVYYGGKEVFAMPSALPDSVTFHMNYQTVGGSVPAASEAVDMGTSVLWAPYNIGASKATEGGDFFAWGETAPKSTYTWGNYRHMTPGCADSRDINKYQVADGVNGTKPGQTRNAVWYSGVGGSFIGDNKKTLEAADDAAQANWKNGWRMPTQAELAQLLNNCTVSYTDNYNSTGVAGFLFTSKKTSKTLFFPAAGYKNEEGATVKGSIYWSSTVYNQTGSAYVLALNTDMASAANWCFERLRGFVIRPVRAK